MGFIVVISLDYGRSIKQLEDRVIVKVEPSPPAGSKIVVKSVWGFGLGESIVSTMPASKKSVIYYSKLEPNTTYKAYLSMDGDKANYLCGVFNISKKQDGKKKDVEFAGSLLTS